MRTTFLILIITCSFVLNTNLKTQTQTKNLQDGLKLVKSPVVYTKSTSGKGTSMLTSWIDPWCSIHFTVGATNHYTLQSSNLEFLIRYTLYGSKNTDNTKSDAYKKAADSVKNANSKSKVEAVFNSLKWKAPISNIAFYSNLPGQLSTTSLNDVLNTLYPKYLDFPAAFKSALQTRDASYIKNLGKQSGYLLILIVASQIIL